MATLGIEEITENAIRAVARDCGSLSIECSDVAGYVEGVAERIGEHLKVLDTLEEVTTRLLADQARVSDSTDEARLLSEQAKAKLEAGREALDTLAPATLTWATGRCDLARNRDLPDPASGGSRFVCGMNPTIAADDTVVVGRVTADADGRVLATIAGRARIPLLERSITRDELLAADEVFVANPWEAELLRIDAEVAHLAVVELDHLAAVGRAQLVEVTAVDHPCTARTV